jgi:hypothetical protein
MDADPVIYLFIFNVIRPHLLHQSCVFTNALLVGGFLTHDVDIY